MNLYYTIHMYKFVQKLAKKKRNQVGFQPGTKMAAASISAHFLYTVQIRLPSEN